MIPEELKTLDRWVCVKNDSKVPFRGFEFHSASSADPDSWCSYATAKAAVDAGHYDGIGFVFNGDGLIGIDIDDGYQESGLLTEKARDIIEHCNSYTEESRSGRGFHILLRGQLPFDGKNNHDGVEIYANKRYFILTGDDMTGSPIISNQAAIDYVIETYFPEAERESTSDYGKRVYNPRWHRPSGGRIPLRPEYPPIMSGIRNQSLASLAGMLHTIGYPAREIYNELLYANEQACDPVLGSREIRGIVQSITRYRR